MSALDQVRSQPTPSLLESILVCPACNGEVEQSAAGLWCRGCGHGWPLADGIPHFGGTDLRAHRLGIDDRWGVARAAAREGWDVALHDRLRALDPRAYRQAVDEYRAQWRFVLPLTETSRIVDLNCGWGAAAFNLAESCGLVVAADACPAQARLVAHRARQTGRHNLVALQLGLDQPFPLREASFDAVALVDGLAWQPDPARQRRIVARARALLRPGGTFLLAEPNRLTVAPRPWSGPRGARTPGGYARLLRSAGFHDLELYAPAPSHLEPFFMIPLDRVEPLSYLFTAILGRQDFGVQARQRHGALLYAAARLVASRLPGGLLARLARPILPSTAIVARR
ncbi:MAG TPA: methyltransferase domain-containing protein [Chloroflexota bacterium]|nr:methyltransferase domain-containing protein [Chloroflexota bacterium]